MEWVTTDKYYIDTKNDRAGNLLPLFSITTSVIDVLNSPNTLTIGTAGDTIFIPGFIETSTFYYQQKIFDGTSTQPSLYINTRTTTLPTGSGVANCCIGPFCGNNITSGHSDTYYGYGAGQNSTTANDCCLYGYNSGNQIVGASLITCMGALSGYSIVNGMGHTNFGYMSGYSNNGASSTYNVNFGAFSGSNITTGSLNCNYGYQSGITNVTGTTVTCIGANADVAVDGLTSASAIGSGAIVTQSNMIQLGRAATDVVNCGSALSVNTIQVVDANAHLVSGGAVPTILANPPTSDGAGTSPTIAITGTDTACTVTLTTGSSPSAGSNVFRITFSKIFGTTPISFVTPINSAAVALGSNQLIPSSTGTTLFIFKSAGNLTGATQYIWNILFIR